MNEGLVQIQIDFEPIGKRVRVRQGTTILQASRVAGIELVAVCGGAGTCGQCRVQIVAGEVTAANATERDYFSTEQLESGWRLACQAFISGALKVNIPSDSLTSLQRLQTESRESVIIGSPLIAISKIVETFSVEQLSNLGFSREYIEYYEITRQESQKNRGRNGGTALVYRDGGPLCVLPADVHPYGLAVDLGTTKIAAFLVDLTTNTVAAKASAPNPQIHFGEDIISRIHYCMEHENGRNELQMAVVATLNEMMDTMRAEAVIPIDQVVEAVVVGNTAMHHFFTGLPVTQLGLAPYSPAVLDPIELKAADLGLGIFPLANVYLPGIIAGYVGADHIAMLIGSGALEGGGIKLAVDIGTNTEISLIKDGEIYSCSCASGPAFEGAHINEGMRAAEGAIERVQIEEGRVQYQVIGNVPPIGICGSGILDAVAEMRRDEILEERGNFPVGSKERETKQFVLVDGGRSGTGRDIVITKRDINEILLAKAAIETGIDILLRVANIPCNNIDKVIIAGAFGTYIKLKSAILIGMLPDLPVERYQQVGNAAGFGARMLLASGESRVLGQDIRDKANYVELTNYPDFQKIYLNALRFPRER